MNPTANALFAYMGDGAGALLIRGPTTSADLGHQIGVTVGEAINPRKTIPAGERVFAITFLHCYWLHILA